MAKRKFTHFVPRPKARKRPRRHKKKLNKHEARDFKKYNRQGRWNDLIFTQMEHSFHSHYHRILEKHKAKKLVEIALGTVMLEDGVMFGEL